MSAISPDLSVYVLDSFALLAYLQSEPAGERVRDRLRQSSAGICRILLSLISLGEVAYIVERRYGLRKTQEILGLIQQEPLEIIEVDRTLVLKSAHIKAHYPLAYADAFVVAVAQKYAGIVITGDPEFQAVENLVPIEWLNRP